MTVATESGLNPVHSLHRGRVRRRNTLLLGASSALHLLILGPMIILAHGDELVFKLPSQITIIQVQLEPPPFMRPVPIPRSEQVTPLTEQTPQPELPKPTESREPTEPTLEALRPLSEVWPVPTTLPQVAPQPAQQPEQVQAEKLDSASRAADLSPLDRALPSVTSLPRQEVESLSPSSAVAAPSSVSVSPPKLATAPAQSSAQADSQTASELNLRRRDEEAQRALAAAAAAQAQAQAQASGPPSPPAPRMVTPMPGVPLPSSGGVGATVPGVSETWRVAPSSQAGRNARALRLSPTGCRFPEQLTESERLVCREQFNSDAARGAERPITGSGNAARDARFRAEGARELYNYEERRRPLSGGAGVVAPADCPGSNFGTGCAGSLLNPSMQQDSSTNIRTRRDGPTPRGNHVPGTAGSGGKPGNGNDR